jgi:hypothetical protein
VTSKSDSSSIPQPAGRRDAACRRDIEGACGRRTAQYGAAGARMLLGRRLAARARRDQGRSGVLRAPAPSGCPASPDRRAAKGDGAPEAERSIGSSKRAMR